MKEFKGLKFSVEKQNEGNYKITIQTDVVESICGVPYCETSIKTANDLSTEIIIEETIRLVQLHNKNTADFVNKCQKR